MVAMVLCAFEQGARGNGPGLDGSFRETYQIIEIVGNPMLVWDQPVSNGYELSQLQHAVLVDGLPIPIDGISCQWQEHLDLHTCRSRLPALTAGEHALTVSVSVRARPELGSTMSAPIVVRVTHSEAVMAPIRRLPSSEVMTADRLKLRRTVVATGIASVVNLAALPDGRVLVAQSSGRILEYREGVVQHSPVLTLQADSSSKSRLLAIAIDPEFADNGVVFVLSVSQGALRLARYRDTAGRLTNASIVFEDSSLSEETNAVIRIGPDRMLYIALGDSSGLRSDDFGSFAGKLLRLNRDGTLPVDQTPMHPVYDVAFDRPSSIAWTHGGRGLWLAGSGVDGSRRIRSLFRGNGNGDRSQFALSSGATDVRIASAPAEARRHDNDSLFIAGAGNDAILLLTIDGRGQPQRSEWLFAGEFSAVTALVELTDTSLLIANGDQLTVLAIDPPK
jgi:hypothetical protein